MKNWRTVVLVSGLLLLLSSVVLYVGLVTSCYPGRAAWSQFSEIEKTAFQRTCRLLAGPTSRFDDFLILFIPGAVLFTLAILRSAVMGKARRSPWLAIFLVLALLEGLFITLAGMLSYPLPWLESAAPVWFVEVVAGLGFLIYIAALGLWHRQRWGLVLFLPAALILAALILLDGLSFIPAAILVLEAILLVFLLRPVWKKME